MKQGMFFSAITAALVLFGTSANAGSSFVDTPEWKKLDRDTHAVVVAAPPHSEKRQCIYVRRFNSEGSFDVGRKFGDGVARDAGVFAYLGRTQNGLIKVAAANYRKDGDLYPLGATEPSIVVMYFHDYDLSFNRWQTEWALNLGTSIPHSRRGVCTPSRI